MRARRWAIGIGGFDCVVAMIIAAALLLSNADPATKGLDNIAGSFARLLLLVTGVPALALAGRAPKTALGFALAFPVCFILVFIVVIIAYAL